MMFLWETTNLGEFRCEYSSLAFGVEDVFPAPGGRGGDHHLDVSDRHRLRGVRLLVRVLFQHLRRGRENPEEVPYYVGPATGIL